LTRRVQHARDHPVLGPGPAGSNDTGFQGNPFQPAGYTTMQTDGNFVTYNGYGGPVWHTWTFNNPGAYLRIGNDGSLDVRRSDGVISGSDRRTQGSPILDACVGSWSSSSLWSC
jgi:hypothetical protein